MSGSRCVVIGCVGALVGVHVVEPFYVMTISKDSTHSRLKEYYQTLHTDLGKKQDERFLQLESSVLESVSQELFEGVAASYGEHVLAAVRAAAMENMEEYLKSSSGSHDPGAMLYTKPS